MWRLNAPGSRPVVAPDAIRLAPPMQRDRNASTGKALARAKGAVQASAIAPVVGCAGVRRFFSPPPRGQAFSLRERAKGMERRAAHHRDSWREESHTPGEACRASGEMHTPLGAPSRLRGRPQPVRRPRAALRQDNLGPGLSRLPADGSSCPSGGVPGLPGMGLRNPPAGTASGPAISTPLDGALRGTGPCDYSPLRNIVKR
ncbi:MAG: hypothetical protein OJF62_000690 [Pseudolabrys sp.]|nr:hypothetical protein [Pseudolabrys sp.]